MNNTTILSLQPNITVQVTDIDDSVGAIIYLIVVLVWYSSGVVILLLMQMTTPMEIVHDSLQHASRFHTESCRDKSTNKKILEELGDKQKREKLWKIYLGTSKDMNDRITRAETLRIENIQRQLAEINRYCRDDNERLQYSYDDHTSNSNTFLRVPFMASANRRLRISRNPYID